MNDAEKKLWIQSQAERDATAHAQAFGGPPSTHDERRQIQRSVKAAFRKKFGWIQTLLWAVTIARIVLQVLDLIYGKVGSKKPQNPPSEDF